MSSSRSFPARVVLLAATSLASCASPDAVETETPPRAVDRFFSNRETTAVPEDAPPAPESAERTNDGAVPAAPESPLPAAPAPAAPPSAAPVAAPRPVPYRGVNLAGGEFGTAIPGTENIDYKWPTTAEVDYFLGKGMNTFRFGFKWERMQPSAFGELTSAYVAKLDALVSYATGKGANVILNPHNFARYYGVTVGSSSVPASAFADFWRRLASRYTSNPRVIFNLVNEPHDMATEQWVTAANAAIAAIRSTGATNMLHVPGNGWTEALNWSKTWYGTSNAKALLDIVDSGNNTVFEAHQYLDPLGGGKSDQCVSATIGRERIQPFIDWLRANKKKGFLGEFAGGSNATCNAAVEDMIQSMLSASDVMVGWLWWAAGPAWRDGYPFDIEPKNGQDRPQMSLLAKFL
jgi:endoglucanase